MKSSPGYISLVNDVKRDTNEHRGVFNPEGCLEGCPGSKCSHEYCDKFKWIIDRVNHYSKILQIDPSIILDNWEQDRDYWYMNYYQDCNQPTFEGDNVRIFETVDDFNKSGIENGFGCPYCKGISKHPSVCDSGLEVNGKICDWKAFGLFGTLGKGTFVFIKERAEGHTIFTPVAWEHVEEVPV